MIIYPVMRVSKQNVFKQKCIRYTKLPLSSVEFVFCIEITGCNCTNQLRSNPIWGWNYSGLDLRAAVPISPPSHNFLAKLAYIVYVRLATRCGNVAKARDKNHPIN